ncbi:MAG: hypothetical protein GY801_53460, partial [bacterium]|nr:hypothetical protein [bacterium]
DHLHSATILTDAAGAEIRRLAYRAFGEEAENIGSGSEPKYSYTGKERDSSGLMYYGARYYDPALSRFITADTLYDRGPQGLNRYSYALNNPIRYNDPSGQTSETWDVFSAGGGSVALWQMLKEFGRFAIPSPGGLAGGVIGAIPLIFHASSVGEGSDEIPLPTIPDAEVPAGPEGPQKKPKRPPSGDRIVEDILKGVDDVIEGASEKALKNGQFYDKQGILRNADGTFASGGETAAAACGREAHESYKNALPGDYEHQVTLPSGKRPDAVNWETRNVRELKPNNPKAISEGRRQVEKYRKELEEIADEFWTADVDTYNQ